ncbi:hypothetical protein AGIG_G10298 [Arapaima gigas]
MVKAELLEGPAQSGWRSCSELLGVCSELLEVLLEVLLRVAGGPAQSCWRSCSEQLRVLHRATGGTELQRRS